MGLFNQPDTVNSRGDVLSHDDIAKLYGDTMSLPGKFLFDPHNKGLKLSAQQRGEMLYNWLTAGGAPKHVEPGKIFKEKQEMAGVEEKASAGQGINSLFGIGKMIGDLSPNITPMPSVTPDAGSVKTIQMIKPMNESPMQPGVPYSALPVGGK